MKITGTATHDLINWYLFKLAKDKASLTKFSNDDDIVIISEPMIRNVKVPKYDLLGKKFLMTKIKSFMRRKMSIAF